MTSPGPDRCEEISELLGIYALDALEPEEAEAVALHLRSCPRCSQEVDQHRETISLLAAGGGEAPARVWDRIALTIGEGADGEGAEGEGADGREGRPAPRLAPLRSRPAGSQPAQPRPRGSRPARSGRPRWRHPGWMAGVAAAAAVAVVIGVQTARVDQLDHRVNQLSSAARQSGGFQGLAAALVDPTAHHYTLISTTGGRPLGQLIILPSGASYLVGSRMPALPARSTYQLWSLVAGRPVSVGLLGDHPGTVAFTVDPAVTATAYMVTVEPAGGVVAPTGSPIGKATV